MPVAEPSPAATMLDALRIAGVQDVVIVPDTHQRSVIERLLEDDEIRLIQASTEDEAVAICAGLIIGGRRPVLQIQHAGLYACTNNLRGIGVDGGLPIVLVIGLLGRDPNKAPRENFGSMVRYAEPLLDALEIPVHLLDGPDDIGQLTRAFDEAEQRGGPVALLVGVETS